MQHIPHFDLLQQPQQNRQMGKWVSRLLSLGSTGCGEEGRVSRAWAWEGLGRPGRESQALSPSSQPRLRLHPGLAGLRAVLSARAEGVVKMAGAQRGSQTCLHTPAPPQPAATPAWNTSPCVLPHPFCSSNLISQIKSLRGSPCTWRKVSISTVVHKTWPIRPLVSSPSTIPFTHYTF